jgi:uncharacterized protein (TIRG00374 family)
MSGKLKTITIWLGAILSVVFLGISFYKIEWKETLNVLRNIHWGYLLIAFLLMWAGFLWRTVRWRRLIDVGKTPDQCISFVECFVVMSIGYMANNILPARIGEVARAYLLSRKKYGTKSFALGTIVTERLADVLMLVLMISFTLLTIKLPPESRDIATGGAAIGFLGAAGLVFAIIFRQLVEKIVAALLKLFRFERFTDHIIEILDRFLKGVSCGGSFKTLGLVWFDSFGIWFLGLLMTWYVALACNLEVGLTQMLYVMCVVNLGAMLPSAPGYVGTYQFFCVFSLGAFGISKERALAFSLVSHITWYLPLTVVGIGLFFRERLNWGQLTTADEELEKVGDGPLEESLTA